MRSVTTPRGTGWAHLWPQQCVCRWPVPVRTSTAHGRWRTEDTVLKRICDGIKNDRMALKHYRTVQQAGQRNNTSKLLHGVLYHQSQGLFRAYVPHADNLGKNCYTCIITCQLWATLVWKRPIVLFLCSITGLPCVVMRQSMFVVALHVSVASLLQVCLYH